MTERFQLTGADKKAGQGFVLFVGPSRAIEQLTVRSNFPLPELMEPVDYPEKPSPVGHGSAHANGPIKEDEDVFVESSDHDIHYKTLSWQVRQSFFSLSLS